MGHTAYNEPSGAFDIQAVRKHFPTLSRSSQVFFNNGAGSLALGEMIDAQASFLTNTRVTMGYTDRRSVQALGEWELLAKERAEFVNASPDEIAFGSSTTQLFRNLSLSLMPSMNSDSEIIVSELCHEAGITAWVSLAKALGITIKWWSTPQSTNPHLSLETLKSLLSPKTRLVTCGHISNVLGTINPIRAIADLVHTIPGAMLSVDGVAWAPHRRTDVKALGVDFYTFSWYKAFGPHVAQIYAKRSTQDKAMTTLNHYFEDPNPLEMKLCLGVPGFEIQYCLTPIVRYLKAVGWDNIVAHETELTEILLKYLRSKPDVYTIYGEPSSDPELRVSLVTFRVNGQSSEVMANKVMDNSDYQILWGHCTSKRVVEHVIGLGDDGIMRVSLVHYNTVEEVQRFTEVLDGVVCKELADGYRPMTNGGKGGGELGL